MLARDQGHDIGWLIPRGKWINGTRVGLAWYIALDFDFGQMSEARPFWLLIPAWPRAMHIRHISTLHIKATEHGHCSNKEDRGDIGTGRLLLWDLIPSLGGY